MNLIDKFLETYESCTTPAMRLYAFVRFVIILQEASYKELTGTSLSTDQKRDLKKGIFVLSKLTDDILSLLDSASYKVDPNSPEPARIISEIQQSFNDEIKQTHDLLVALHDEVVPKIADMILPAIFERAASYFRTVATVGYASFFGIWVLTQDHLSNTWTIVAALLMLLSVSCYAINELVNMALTIPLINKVENNKDSDPLATIEQVSSQVTRSKRITSRLTPLLIYPAIFCAIVSVGIMLFAFVAHLLTSLPIIKPTA